MHRDQLPIPNPCAADWSAMSGDDQRRFCSSCNKHVHDLSAMTARRAQALVDTKSDLCVRYVAEEDGRVRHAPSRLASLVAAGLMLVAAPAFASGMVQQAPVEPTTTAAEPTVLQRLAKWLQDSQPVQIEPRPPVMGAPPPPPRPVVAGGLARDPRPPPPPVVPQPVVIPPIVVPPAGTIIPEAEEALRNAR